MPRGVSIYTDCEIDFSLSENLCHLAMSDMRQESARPMKDDDPLGFVLFFLDKIHNTLIK